MSDRKPLELVVYRRCPDHADRGGCDYWVPADMHGPDAGYGEWVRWQEWKRLTDAELAAELHRAVADVFRAKGRDAELNAATDRMLTMTRFATSPDHDTPE